MSKTTFHQQSVNTDMSKSSSTSSNRKYLFSDSSDEGKHFYLREYTAEEMNDNPQIRLMVANTMYRAAENYKNNYRHIDPDFIDPDLEENKSFYSKFRHYLESDTDIPLIKDSNIAPKNMRGFILENAAGEPASLILAGITHDPLRVMMGTIDTDDRYEGRGYFSILFDEIVHSVAQQNGDELPKIVISMRNLTSRGQNFDVYTNVIKSRNFDLQGLQREINPEKTENNVAILPDDSSEDKIIFRMTPNFTRESEEFQEARRIVKAQPFEAVFLQGSAPAEMNLRRYMQDSQRRFDQKIAKSNGNISIGMNVESAINLQNGRQIDVEETSKASAVLSSREVENSLAHTVRK